MILFMRDELRAIGNGDVKSGARSTTMDALWLENARIKHPDWAGKGPLWALDALEEEVRELRQAIENGEGDVRIESEARDAKTILQRMINHEYEPAEEWDC